MKITIESDGYIGQILDRDAEIDRERAPIMAKPSGTWTPEEYAQMTKLADESRSIAFQLLGAIKGRFEDAASKDAARRAARTTRKNARAQSALAS